jgi:hypothetical protein
VIIFVYQLHPQRRPAIDVSQLAIDATLASPRSHPVFLVI